MLFRLRDLSDAEAVRAVLQGRSQRFAVLVDRYKNLVYSTLLARIRQQDEVDDLAQETFLRAFRHLDTLEDPRKFGPWVRQIAANQALNFLRARHRQQVSAEELELPVPEQPDQVFAAAEERQRIWQAIGQLSEDHREILLLFYMEEYSLQQIAAFLELRPDSARMRLRRAREALRGQLEEEFDRKVRQAVQEKRRDKKFTQKIMSALPLVPWSAKVAPLAVARMGWGFLGLAALTEVGLISLMVGWLPLQAPRQAPVEDQVIRLEWVSRETPGPAASYFGEGLLSTQGQALQEEALRQGKGGRLEWNFDQGAQGWQARVAPYDRGPRGALPTQVSDGVLRISLGPYQPGRVPAIELVSPELGYESGLFDRLELRARLVSQAPMRGSFVLNWTNPLNRLFPGFEPRFLERQNDAERAADQGQTRYSRFAAWNPGGEVVYGRQWHELVMDNLDHRPQTRWTGDLVDLRATLVLADTRGNQEVPPEAFPQALEIDRIVLDNAHRTQAQALPLPEGEKARSAGQWLDQGSFYPLGQTGLKWPVLGDLDGDGDLDLVIGFEQTDQAWQVSQGLVRAFNDGKGRFALGGKVMLEKPKEGEKQQSYNIILLSGADLDGDGDLDLLVHRGMDTVLLQNIGEGTFEEANTWKDRFCAGVADLEGDGDEDIALIPYEKATYDLPMEARTWNVALQLNDGRGHFRAQQIEPPASGQGWFPKVLDDFNGDGRAELVWRQTSERSLEENLLVCSGYEEGTWQQQERIPFQTLKEAQQYALWTALLYLGDLGADGQWELGLPQGAYTEGRGTNSFGIEVVGSRLPAVPTPWLPRQVHLRLGFPDQPPLIPQTWDLDQDGLADPLFLDFNYRRGVQLLVLRGQRGVWPVEEGGYPLPAEPSGWVAGDVDGDGDVDVVVPVEGVEGAGLCVFRNQAGKRVANR